MMPEPVIDDAWRAPDWQLRDEILEWSKKLPSRKMSSEGDAWHSVDMTRPADFVTFAVARATAGLGQTGAVTGFRWWTSVIRRGGHVKGHNHDGRWSFVWHLSHGSDLLFFWEGLDGKKSRTFPTEPGRFLVFPSWVSHATVALERGPEPRVTVSGNLHFEKRTR